MPKKDLVKEFKAKVHQIEDLTGWKYKILYKDYKGALENNRLHVYWHKPCKLAEITTPEGVVSFEVTGHLEGVLEAPDGLVCVINDQLKPMSPFDTTTVDDVGISHDGISINNDKDVIKYCNPKSSWKLKFKSENYIQASMGEKVYAFEDASIAKCIFDIEAIKKFIASNEEVHEEPAEEAALEATENVVVEEPETSVEEPVREPVAEEPAPAETPAEESTKEPAAEPTPDEEPIAKKKEKKKSMIKDSGNRTQFKSGAVRDIQQGKGRCDLLPLDIVGEFFETEADKNEFEEISLFMETHDRVHLIRAAKKFSQSHFDCDETAILEYACHLEDGCNKYGDRNWELGIPLERYVDSGIRHLLKCRRGDDDERHDRAFIWNMLCGAWTAKHHPDLI